MSASRVARFIPVTLLLALSACDAPVAPDPLQPEALQAHMRGAAGHDGTVSKPFQARLFTVPEFIGPDEACGEPPFLLNVQVGEGTSTHLGRFTVRITFCMDASAVLDDGVLGEGESVPYDQGWGVLTAANGDELYLEIAGAVLPSDHPSFDFEFHDPFQFAGGTGRFAGATGDGSTDTFVTQTPERSTHAWHGTLVLPGGQQD